MLLLRNVVINICIPNAINYTDYFLLRILKQSLTDNFGKAAADFVLEMYRDAG
jgi:hypothetical protein